MLHCCARWPNGSAPPKWCPITSAQNEGAVDRDLWRKAGAAGLLCAQIPEEYGGGGGSYAHDAAITEAFGHTGADGFCLPLHNAITSPYLVHYGSEAQKRRFLPRLASGELVSAICMTEPGGGSDLQAVKTTARRQGDHYVLNGSKTFITNGQQANLLIVFVKTDPSAGARGVSLVLAETDGLAGFERGRNLNKIGLKANDTWSCSSTTCAFRCREPSGGGRGAGFLSIDGAIAAGAAADRQSGDGRRSSGRWRQRWTMCASKKCSASGCSTCRTPSSALPNSNPKRQCEGIHQPLRR